tara:strand:- start:418 stop:621 length:204 start_codon:yes stop_codon:yes gene_type:complete
MFSPAPDAFRFVLVLVLVFGFWFGFAKRNERASPGYSCRAAVDKACDIFTPGHTTVHRGLPFANEQP